MVPFSVTPCVTQQDALKAVELEVERLKQELSDHIATISQQRKGKDDEEKKRFDEKVADLTERISLAEEKANDAEIEAEKAREDESKFEKKYREEKLKNTFLARQATRQRAGNMRMQATPQRAEKLFVLKGATVLKVQYNKYHLGLHLCLLKVELPRQGCAELHYFKSPRCRPEIGDKPTRAIPMSEIFTITSGPTANPATWKNIPYKTGLSRDELRLRSFSIILGDRSYDFIAHSDVQCEKWVVGLGMFMPNPGTTIVCREEYIVRNVQIKLHAYCKAMGITHTQMWKDAIKTVEIKAAAKAAKKKKPPPPS